MKGNLLQVLTFVAIGVSGILIYRSRDGRPYSRFGPPSVDEQMERDRAINSYLRDRRKGKKK